MCDMDKNRRLSTCFTTVIVGLVLGWTALCGQAYAASDAYLIQGRELVVSDRGGDYLRFQMVAWGPNWAWTGIKADTRKEGVAAVSDLSAVLGGTGVPIRGVLRAEPAGAKRLALSVELKAERDTDLTLIVLEMATGRAFQGRQGVLRGADGETRVNIPFGRGVLGRDVKEMVLRDDAGRTTTLQFASPVTIQADGAARIVLAADHLKASQNPRIGLTLELPDDMTWYPTTADIPDEPGMETWYDWTAAGLEEGSRIGLEDWLEKPAGGRGRIVRRDDKLYDGDRPIKLWGLNLCYSACAPEKELAEKRARLYSRYGINAVRLHKFADGPGWAGIQSPESCLDFDPEALDRMDYQVAKFKEAGIFVKLSAHFGTPSLGPKDVPYVPYIEEFGSFSGKPARIRPPHSAVHYSPELQDVQIRQIRRILEHRNPYTGLTYAEDPVVAFIEIINEQSILFYSSMEPLKKSATLRRTVGERFCRWLTEKYGSQEKLVEAWGKAALDSFSNEMPGMEAERLERGTILPLGNPWFWDPDQLEGSQAFRKQRLLDTLQFLYELQCEFYGRYVNAVREAGYSGELVASNWQAGRAFSHFANLHSDYLVGTIDRHNYFGGDKVNATMLSRAGSGMLSSGLQQAADRPFMLSEWIHVFPNEMGVEGPAVIGAYGMGLQGWDVSFMFQNGDDGGFSKRLGRQQWDVTAPQVLGVFPAVARQVLRGDVIESDRVVSRNVHIPSLFEGKLGFEDRVVQGYDAKELSGSQVPAEALAAARCVVTFTDAFRPTPPFDFSPYLRDGAIVASTGRLVWREGDANGGGCITINTPATKAAVGFFRGEVFDLGEVVLAPRSRFGAVYVTARERDGTLTGSRELLITAMARARNTNAKVSPDGARLLVPGEGPVRMEPVSAEITIRRQGKIRVLVLDQAGQETGRELPVERGRFTIDGARDRTPYYLVEID
ncbi:hypothetical protein JCM17478_33050 [Thermopirellula anaerolimosa]